MNRKRRQAEATITEWSKLDSIGRPILKRVAADYESLIHAPKVKEHVTHSFLARHANLFFRDNFNYCTAISKLRFGAEYVSDFVVVYDNWSAGVCYRFIEIERPDTAPFTKEGIASSRLSRAIQQVLCWKVWLESHASEARRLFPSRSREPDGRPGFTFEIVIGTRQNSTEWLEHRNTLASSLGIEIRSFDSLADRIKRRVFLDDLSSVGDERDSMPMSDLNRLASPFLGAMSDPEWREAIRGARNTTHFMHAFGPKLIRILTESKEANEFRRLLGVRSLVRPKPSSGVQLNLLET